MAKTTPFSLNSLSPLRIAIYSALIACTSFTLIGYTLLQKKREWQELDEKIERVILLSQKEALQMKQIETIKANYKDGDARYLQKYLEPLSLMQKEKNTLQKIIQSPGFCGQAILERRLDYLTSSSNRIKLSEQPLYNSPQFKETELKLERPIEVDLKDLEKILNTIEKENNKKPFLQITKFDLKRKKPIDQNEFFEINFTILKKEFLQ